MYVGTLIFFACHVFVGLRAFECRVTLLLMTAMEHKLRGRGKISSERGHVTIVLVKPKVCFVDEEKGVLGVHVGCHILPQDFHVGRKRPCNHRNQLQKNTLGTHCGGGRTEAHAAFAKKGAMRRHRRFGLHG